MSNQKRAFRYKELQCSFAEYLRAQGKAESTAATMKSDAFYLANSDSGIDLIALLQSDDFEARAYEQLRTAVHTRSKAADKASAVAWYMKCLRQLRDFVLSNNSVVLPKAPVTVVDIPVQEPAAPVIPRPSCSMVDEYLRKWNTADELSRPEAMLKKLFTETLPENTSIDDIMLKTAALNTVYSTHIYSVYPVAQHILSLNIDKRLRAGDETLVNELMQVLYDDGKTVNHYSFTTKYCSFHHPDAFPIYDSFIEKILLYYRDRENFFHFKDRDLKNYPMFKQILREFRRHFGLQAYTTKELDQFLWQFGKDYF